MHRTDMIPLQLRRTLRLAAAIAAVGALIAIASASCRAPARMVERSGVAMGSELRLTARIPDEAAARPAFDAVFVEFERLESLMSTWRPGSDVVRINAAAGVQPVPVAADVRDVLRQARQISEWTEGTFDVTFGALTDIWKFDHDQDNTIPAAAAIRARLPLIDYRQIEIDDRAGTVFLKRRGMRIHLGGIGKGYAVDRAVAILRKAGLRDFMIQAGGDLYVGGTRNGQPWRLGIQDPRGRDGRTFATVDLTDSTLSTSGDYARFFIKDGVRYHHILDLRTGQPARLCRSVTIAAASPVLADAVAKGVFILGPEKGMALVERIPDLDAVIVTANNEVLVSSGLKHRFVLTSKPTDAP
ncbi:MAG: FAD:protein transferase [Acidobacteria bacterium]|nr:FAD:protein transferase [Acidobacteriota bacterium]